MPGFVEFHKSRVERKNAFSLACGALINWARESLSTRPKATSRDALWRHARTQVRMHELSGADRDNYFAFVNGLSHWVCTRGRISADDVLEIDYSWRQWQAIYGPPQQQ